MVCTSGAALLIFDMCTAAEPILGQCKHKISTASPSVAGGTDVFCVIGTSVLIFGQSKHRISTTSVVVCIIGIAVLIFVQCKPIICTALVAGIDVV